VSAGFFVGENMVLAEKATTLVAGDAKVGMIIAELLGQLELVIVPEGNGVYKIDRDAEIPDGMRPVAEALIKDLAGETISVETLELLHGAALHEHYRGPRKFNEVVLGGDNFGQNLQETSVPVEERWRSAEDLPENLKGKVTIFGFDSPEIKKKLAEVSDWAQYIMPLADEFENLSPAKQNELITLAKQYAENIDYVMAFSKGAHRKNSGPNTVGVTLLSGGLRFKEDFPTANPADVDAKRLTFGRFMDIGFGEWEGIDKLNDLTFIEPAFVDDCGATFSTILAAIVSLKHKAEAKLVPPIGKIRVYLTVATQQGIVEFAKALEELGIKDFEIYAGDLAYQLSSLGYIERAQGELKPNGEAFTENQAYVGDMGFILGLARMQLKAALN
jgi:uracil phosphoribosyltransferase